MTQWYCVFLLNVTAQVGQGRSFRIRKGIFLSCYYIKNQEIFFWKVLSEKSSTVPKLTMGVTLQCTFKYCYHSPFMSFQISVGRPLGSIPACFIFLPDPKAEIVTLLTSFESEAWFRLAIYCSLE